MQQTHARGILTFETLLARYAFCTTQSFRLTYAHFNNYSSSFYVCCSDLTRRICNVTQYPTLETNGRDQHLFSDTVLELVKNVTVPINVLHVTSMSAFRSDAHVGNWSDNPSIQDCSHWCLPGVPDMWNEIILSQLFTEYEIPFPQMESQGKFSHFQIIYSLRVRTPFYYIGANIQRTTWKGVYFPNH